MGSDLVAKLGTDNTAWDSGFKQATATAGSWSSGLTSLFSPVGAGLAAVGATVGVMAGTFALAGKGIGDFGDSLESARKLSAVLEATGGAAGVSTSEIQALAGELQQLTNFEDDATTGAAAALAAFTNVRGDVFKDAIVSAADLSVIMGGELKDNIKILGKALNDPEQGLKKLARAGVTFSDSQKQQIALMQQSGDLLGAQNMILQNVQDKFGGAAQAVADPWKQLMNTFGDTSEMIGSALMPSFRLVTSWANTGMQFVTSFSDSFMDFGIEAGAALSTFGGLLMTVGESITSTVSPAIDFISSSFGKLIEMVGLSGVSFQDLVVTALAAFENIGGITTLGVEMFKLFAVQAGAEMAHLFTETIPAYLNWFGENWQEIFITAASNTLTVFENLGTNIKSAWASVLAFFQGTPIAFDWKPLTDGFINTVSKLPDVAPRVIGELEQGLTRSVADAALSLSTSMGASREAFNQAFSNSRENMIAQFSTESKVPSGAIVPDADASHEKKATHEKAENKVALAGSSEAALIASGGQSKLEKIGEKQLGKFDTLIGAVKDIGAVDLGPGEDID